jgi:LPPG:FO 2-phospho-L-lactate transferase
MSGRAPRCLALSGGVGGAKLALGLAHAMAPEDLLVVANTGDDFEHLGLLICPDIDTVAYTLAGVSNPETGWGRAGETWSFMEAQAALGGETWFRLGDRDLAVHLERTRRTAAGETLSAVTADLARRLGGRVRIAPMSDRPVRTIVETPDGPLPFQHYFVRERCRPRVTGFRFEGAAAATPSPAFAAALAGGPEAIVICPSNPFISIDPILAVPGVRDALARRSAPAVAVSPIVGGRAIKGPTAKMMTELGIPSDASAVAEHYRGLIDGFILDRSDAASAAAVERLGLAVLVTGTVMQTLDDKAQLAREALDFARSISPAGGRAG